MSNRPPLIISLSLISSNLSVPLLRAPVTKTRLSAEPIEMQRRADVLLSLTCLLSLGVCLVLGEDTTSRVDDLKSRLLSPINLDVDTNPIVDQIKRKCADNGGETAYDILVLALENTKACIEGNFNHTVIESEIEEKRKTGDMDLVFSKYCARVPTVRGCVETAVRAIEACLADSEKPSLRLLVNITDSLVNFGCYKDGDRIAMFIAEGGPECVESKSTEIEKCWSDLVDGIDMSEFSLNNLPTLTDNTKGCTSYNTMQNCVVTALEACDDSTPANIVEALFRYVRRLTPCKNHKS